MPESLFAPLLKKRLWRRCFPVNFVKFLRTLFCIEHLWWLLLYGPKYTTSFPYSASKEVSHKPLKVAAAKEFFLSVFIIDTTCFDECFPFHVITANSIFYTNLLLPRGMVQPPCCCVLSNKCFERSPHVMSFISTIILP